LNRPTLGLVDLVTSTSRSRWNRRRHSGLVGAYIGRQCWSDVIYDRRSSMSERS
jgi:hypothetical protein